VLRSFYTNQYTHKRILLPPSAHILRVEPDSEAFKMKKASPLFSHLKELLAAPGVQQFIARTPRMIEEVLRLLAIFTEMNPTKRAAENHVEYESEAWIKAFQVSGDLGRVARLWSLSYSCGTRKDLWFTLASISREIYRMATLAAPGLDASKFPAPAWHTVAFGRREWRVLALDVQAAFMSFHHPMHWLLAGCLKLVTMMEGMRPQELREVLGAMLDGAAALEDEDRIRQTNDMILVIMDVPLKGTCPLGDAFTRICRC
jgi:E3 ubiquitin-protein ligase UBR1